MSLAKIKQSNSSSFDKNDPNDYIIQVDRDLANIFNMIKAIDAALHIAGGTVTSVSIVTANGISGSVATPTTTPAVTLTLGAITPISVAIGGGTALTTSNQTGSGNLVLATSPTLVTPVIGAATGTSLNLSGLTASRGVATDGSKNLISVSTPTIQNSGRSTAQTAAVASVASYSVGASDGSFIVSANVLITASVTHSFSCTCTYTDEGNTSRTLTLNFSQLTGTFVTTLTNILGASAYEGVPVHLRCKASTSITIATTGTFTSVTYNVEGYITQIG